MNGAIEHKKSEVAFESISGANSCLSIFRKYQAMIDFSKLKPIINLNIIDPKL